MSVFARLKQMASLSVLALVLTCSSLDNFTVEESSDTVIPKRMLLEEVIGEFAFLGFEGFNIEQSEEFKNAGYTKDQIDSIRLLTLNLDIIAPSTGNFDFLEDIAFFVEADGQPRIPIASLEVIAPGLTQLVLDIEGAELVEYFVAPSVKITTEATGLRPEEETTIRATVALDIDINVDGSLGCD